MPRHASMPSTSAWNRSRRDAVRESKDYRGRKVHLVPVERWDERMAVVVGVLWDKADEARILERARALGWEPVR